MLSTSMRHGARFSVTARQDRSVRRAIDAVAPDGWTAIRYPQAVWDDAAQEWISDAEVAEITYTAFTSRRKADHITARLIVRRVRRLNDAASTEQGALFTTWRYQLGRPGARRLSPHPALHVPMPNVNH